MSTSYSDAKMAAARTIVKNASGVFSTNIREAAAAYIGDAEFENKLAKTKPRMKEVVFEIRARFDTRRVALSSVVTDLRFMLDDMWREATLVAENKAGTIVVRRTK